MTETSGKLSAGWIAAAVLAAIGVIIHIGLQGYGFTAMIFYGLSAVALMRQALRHLAVKHPGLSRVMLRIMWSFLGIGLIGAVFTGIVIFQAGAGQAVPCDFVVVLGAGVNGTVPSLSLQERIDAAYDYLLACPDAVCVVSGGRGGGEDISEAECMFRELTARGIQKDRVWMEDQASDTRENLRFSLDLIQSRTGSRPAEIGLVSSEYHLFRAGSFAMDENVIPHGIPARTGPVTLRINYYLREIAAVWYYCFLGG